MKKNVLKRTFAAVAVSALALSASAVSAFAEENEYIASYGFSDDEIAASEVKPTISIDKKTITLEEAKNPQSVTVNVSGADYKYATLGLYFAYDARLTVVPSNPNEVMAVETAFIRVAGEQRDLGQGAYNGIQYNGQDPKWIYMNGAASSDMGRDGLALTITFNLPADAAAGDKYPVELVYRSSESIVSRFTDAKNTQTGKLMQAWLFTQGIDNGYIEIEAVETTTTEETTTTTEETTTTVEETTTTTTAAAQSTTAKATTTAAKATTTAAPQNAPKTGVAGAGVAVAGLAVAVGTAFVLRKKED